MKRRMPMLQTTQEVLDLLDEKKEFLFIGAPGTGKTFAAEEIAAEIEAELLVIQVTSGTRIEDLRYQALPDSEATSGIVVKPGILTKALKMSQEKKVLVLLDEWDKTPTSMDASLLMFLQNARIEYEAETIVGNKENLIVILTSNFGRELTEPLMRRVAKIEFPLMSAEFVEEQLSNKISNTEIIRFLVKVYKISLNYDLRKPSSLQELVEFGKFVEKKKIELTFNEKMERLLETLIFKYQEDWYSVRSDVAELLSYDRRNPKFDEIKFGTLTELQNKAGVTTIISMSLHDIEKFAQRMLREHSYRPIFSGDTVVGLYNSCACYGAKDIYYFMESCKRGQYRFAVLATLDRIYLNFLTEILEGVTGTITFPELNTFPEPKILHTETISYKNIVIKDGKISADEAGIADLMKLYGYLSVKEQVEK